MAINKVVFGNEVKMDLTNDSVSADNLLEGETAHDRSGSPVVGTAKQGHSILDRLGTLLTQRSKLKFGGMLKTTDDATNGVTEVSDLAEEIDWSVWSAMTEAQRNAYSAGKKLDIVNAPWASGKINTEVFTKLWENPNPTSSFVAQNITLLSDDYDFLLAIYKPLKNSTYYCAALVDSRPLLLTAFDSSKNESYRQVICNGSNTLTINGGYYNATADNDACVPTAIYGFKKNIEFDLTAVVANVSTDASKCMLSDGETSVEDAIDGLTSNNMGAPELVTAGTAYTTPSNGYIQIYVRANSEIDLSVLSSGNNNGVRFDVINTASSGIYQFTYVTKGLRILWSASTANNGAVSFSPLV